jgi:hypothetical protein
MAQMSTNVDIVSDVKYYLLHKYRRLEIYHPFFFHSLSCIYYDFSVFVYITFFLDLVR